MGTESGCDRIQHYFWIISDWAYLGVDRLNAMAEKHQVGVDHYPVRLLDVYSRTGGIPLPERSNERQSYRFEEMRRWRDRLGMPLVLEPRHFPPDDQLASCVVYAHIAAGEDAGRLSARIMAALWADNLDIADADILRDICRQEGLDADTLIRKAGEPSMIAEYDRATEQAIAAGVFGSPFYIYKGHRFWGQDRLDFLMELVADNE